MSSTMLLKGFTRRSCWQCKQNDGFCPQNTMIPVEIVSRLDSSPAVGRTEMWEGTKWGWGETEWKEAPKHGHQSLPSPRRKSVSSLPTSSPAWNLDLANLLLLFYLN